MLAVTNRHTEVEKEETNDSDDDDALLNDSEEEEKEPASMEEEPNAKEEKPTPKEEDIVLKPSLLSSNGIMSREDGSYMCTFCKKNLSGKKEVLTHVKTSASVHISEMIPSHKKSRKQSNTTAPKKESKYPFHYHLTHRSLKKQEELRNEIASISGTEQASLLYGSKAWSDFSLHPTLLANLTSLHCEKPTIIQEQGVDAACRGKDVLGAAPTGSGKTLAFSVPLVDWLLKHPAGNDEKWRVRAVVISPTRELALQTLRVLTRLCEGGNVR